VRLLARLGQRAHLVAGWLAGRALLPPAVQERGVLPRIPDPAGRTLGGRG